MEMGEQQISRKRSSRPVMCHKSILFVQFARYWGWTGNNDGGRGGPLAYIAATLAGRLNVISTWYSIEIKVL